MREVLDLCSGTGSATAPWRECGHRVITIDNDPNRHPDVLMDVRKLVPPSDRPEFVWASPPCVEYSYVRTFNKHTKERYAYAPDLSVWKACATFIADANPQNFVIENVLGAQRSWGKPTYKFGPWCLWTDIPNLTVGPVPGKSKLVWDPRYPTTRRTAVIPRAIAEAVHRAVCPKGDRTSGEKASP